MGLNCRECQAFVEKFEGALGKGKGRKLYAYKVIMAKVTFPRPSVNFTTESTVLKMSYVLLNHYE